MKYLILIYHSPKAREQWLQMPAEQRAIGMRAYAALSEDLAKLGELIVTEALADPSSTKQVTVRDGRTIVTDGPFAEAKEQLAGFFLVDCDSVKRVTEIAARLPDAGVATIEIRPVMELQGQEM